MSTAMAELRERHNGGLPVGLDEVFDAAGLEGRERHVIRERLAGRSFADIAGDGSVSGKGGRPYTRQRIQQLERDGLRRLGLSRLLSEAVHGRERAERAQGLAEAGRRLEAGRDGGSAVHMARRGGGWMEPWERAHERRVTAFLAAACA
jgi:hypothetical protein